MFYLILAIISSALVSIMMRVAEGRVKNNISLLAVNYIVCSIFAVAILCSKGIVMPSSKTGVSLLLGLLNGVFYISSLVVFQYSVKKNGVVMSSIFMKLGILIPMFLSVILFHEVPGVKQIVGILCAFAAIVLINFEKGNTKVALKGVLVLVLLGCGCADGMSKIYEELGTPELEEVFLLLTFVVAFLLSFGIVKFKKQRFGKAEWIYGILLGVPNYFSARFLLKALGEVPAVIVYPTFSVGTIAVISLAGVLIFRERFSKKQLAAIGIIMVSLVLLN